MSSRLGFAAALLALLAPALTTVGVAPAAAADPMYGAATAGECFHMNLRELAAESYTEAPVDCAGTHTSRMISLSTLPDGISYEDIGRVTNAVLPTCLGAASIWLDTTTLGIGMTAYNYAFFVPTPEQQAVGARWLRCDLILHRGKRLAPLPTDLEVGKLPYDNSVARCLTGRNHRLTVCSARHAFRAVAAVTIKGSRYPSARRWARLAHEICHRVAPRRYDWFTGASKAMWRAGNHTLVCYTRTRR